MRNLAVALACVAAATLYSRGAARAAPAVGEQPDVHTIEGSTTAPDSLEIVGVLDDFAPGSSAAWTAKGGSNINVSFVAGWSPTQLNMPLGRLHVWRKSESVTSSGANFVSLSRQFQPRPDWARAEALRVILASRVDTDTWMECTVGTRRGSFKHVIDPRQYPARRFQDRVLRFKDFKGNGRLDPAGITGVSFVAYGSTNNFYFAEIQLVREARMDAWLRFATSSPKNHLFERGQAVELTFRPEGALPAGCTGFRYEVRDFFRDSVKVDTFRFAAGAVGREFKGRLGVLPTGYYEVRAYWTGVDKGLAARPCIKEPGTMPLGMSTFAVMPRTIEENHAAMVQESYFGLHWGDVGQLDYMGCPWVLEQYRWTDVEGAGRPARPGGVAEWARKRMQGDPQPAHRFGILSLRPNIHGEIPAWARTDGSANPGWKDWSDFEAYARDCVRLYRQQYPHMKPRVVDLFWEVDLNMPPHNFPAPWTPKQVVDLFRRLRPIVKEADPEAILIGPCPSSGINCGLDWWRPFFEAGLCRYIDAVSAHMYHRSPPEEAGLPEFIRALNAMIKKYAGRRLPIYTTEWGFVSEVGSQNLLRATAEWTVRGNIIMQGEGLRASLVFYAYDYKPSWGIAFNLDPEFERRRWGPPRIAPKPATVALAVQGVVLGRAKPVRRVTGLGPGDDVWCYEFVEDGKPIWALWSAGETATVSLRVRTRRPVEVVDIMGARSTVRARGGRVRLEVGPAPKYVVVP